MSLQSIQAEKEKGREKTRAMHANECVRDRRGEGLGLGSTLASFLSKISRAPTRCCPSRMETVFSPTFTAAAAAAPAFLAPLPPFAAADDDFTGAVPSPHGLSRPFTVVYSLEIRLALHRKISDLDDHAFDLWQEACKIVDRRRAYDACVGLGDEMRTCGLPRRWR